MERRNVEQDVHIVGRTIEQILAQDSDGVTGVVDDDGTLGVWAVDDCQVGEHSKHRHGLVTGLL